MLAVASSSDLVPGDVILVRYAEDDLWHERVLCWPVPMDKSGVVDWVVATPDGDMYIETIEGGNPEESLVEWIRPAADGRLPAAFQDPVYALPRAGVVDDFIAKCVKKGTTLALEDSKEHDETPISCSVVRLANGRRVAIEDLVWAGHMLFGSVKPYIGVSSRTFRASRRPLHDRGPAPATTPACYTVYVDNFGAGHVSFDSRATRGTGR
ncbi:unnamed protein product [Prorocentrum cordatum]|uniref:Uncharacterized protein n=1 Tax=Prorocentrum cordatum TaxID=2364126 RepID=A0ABN9VVI1_9DINO|nr:unnamed protein product [Polarella glacialis]